MAEGKDKKSKTFNREVFQRIFTLVKPYKTKFALTGLIVIFLASVAVVRPTLVRIGIDDYVSVGDNSGFTRIIIFYVLVLMVEVMMQYFQVYLSNWVAQSVTLDLRSRLFKKAIRFKLRYFDQIPVGTFVTRLVSDIDGVSRVFSNGILVIIGDLLKLLVIFCFMFYVDWSLTLWMLMPIPVLLFATKVFQQIMKKAFVQVRNQVNKINVFVQEHVTGMSVVQIFNREEREFEKFDEINEKHRTANIKTIWAFSVFFPIVDILASVSIAVMLWWGIGGVIDEKYSFGTIMQMSFLIFMVYRPIRQLADRFTVLQDGLVNGERVFKLMDEEQNISDEGAITDDFVGGISFKNVWFAYDDESAVEEEEWVLKGLTFEVNPGETVAFVGPTGAGKSSIINLIGRYYSYQKGNIFIDDNRIEDYSLESIRQQVSVVLQDVFLFSDTVYNNITLHDTGISKEAVIEAAKAIGAHKFIMKLPGGYDCEVGERGGLLSVGQRQLISFIRAYVQNPSLLILDEATSSVDSESEELIQNATEKLTGKRTSIVIAHRLSTIRNADRIFVIDDGKIVERGSHEELIKIEDGHYKRLYDMQFDRE